MQIRMKNLAKDASPQTVKRNCNILMVDDESSILDAYRTILSPPKLKTSRRAPGTASQQQSEYQLFFAESGERAVQIYQEQLEKGDPIAVGFFDMIMPGGIDGAETIRQIREIEPSILCVIVTAYTDRDPKDIRQLFDDQSTWIYMNKPFNDGEINQLAENMVFGWNLRKENESYRLHLETLVKQRTEQLNIELHKVSVVQKSLLPQTLPKKKGLDIGVYYETCIELGGGGDYYDIIELPENRVGIAIADASGHGPSAACIMAITRAMFRTLIQQQKIINPGEVLTALNRMVDGNYPRGHFVTMLYAVLDLTTGLVTYANAGHPYPIYGKRGTFQPHEGDTAMILGMFPGSYSESQLQLQPGDHLLLFTDGIEEHRNLNREQFGYSRILEVCERHAQESPQQLINGIVKEANAFRPNLPREDDFTFIGIRWNA